MSIGREARSGHGRAQGFVCAYFVYIGTVFLRMAKTPKEKSMVNSNVFSALGAIMMIPYAVEGIRRKHFTYPKWIQVIQYSGAICTTLTMIFVIFLIFPVAGSFVAFGGIYVWLHLVCPIMSLILLFSVDSNIEITKKD